MLTLQPPTSTTLPATLTKGRGAVITPHARFVEVSREDFDDGWDVDEEVPVRLKTTVTEERARSVISRNQSPDVPFAQSLNPYRGCEHGCVYCYARPSHAYLDLSPGLDFESRLFAKVNVVEVLRQELGAPGYRCLPLALGANTDAYQPIERQFKLTRGILELLAKLQHPVTLVTKAALIERDLDVLAPMAARGLVEVFLSVTTLDHELARRMEPRATAPRRRVETIRRLAAQGVPVGVMFAPAIAGLNDHEMETVIGAAADAGATSAAYVVLRLPREINPMFQSWLELHYPLRAAKVMSLMRAQRGGQDYDSAFAQRMKGSGPIAQLLARRFTQACRKAGLNQARSHLDTTLFMPPPRFADQLTLF
jgi:DNA repair photolyase